MQSKPANIMIFYGVRPAVTGLITTAAIFVAETAFLKSEAAGTQLSQIFSKPLSFIDFGGIIISILTLVALVKFKLHPILTIIGAGATGVVV
jgi:chromate transporter